MSDLQSNQFHCACGAVVSVFSYMADGAVETESRCRDCGRQSYDYHGYHDRGPGPSFQDVVAAHNASQPRENA